MFVTKLKSQGLSDCYVNRNLVLLKAILRYGLKNSALRELPEFPKKFDERSFARTGHSDSRDFAMLVDHVPETERWLEALVTAAY